MPVRDADRTDTRPWAVKPGEESTWWNVDFGEGRVVTVSNYDLQIGQYRHEVGILGFFP